MLTKLQPSMLGFELAGRSDLHAAAAAALQLGMALLASTNGPADAVMCCYFMASHLPMTEPLPRSKLDKGHWQYDG